MSYAASEGARDRPTARAAIFVDYENLFHTLSETARQNGEVGSLISEMIEALKRGLLEERETQTAVSHAYADFTELSGMGDALQRALYLQGVESRFVPQSLQSNAVEIQLCVDAMDMLHHRADINMFVLLTGSRSYLPLMQHFKRYGRRVLIVALEEPAAFDHFPDGDWFFDAHDLLSSSGRRALARPAPAPAHSERASSNPERHPASAQLVEEGQPSFQAVDDPILIRGLEIIEEHFGQYEEVYLTPLLRKMSEVLDDQTFDPKTIISDLEDRHVVRLEKRQGFPHDYTVLIVERDHPDVERVQQEVSERAPYYFDDVGSSYEEDDDLYEDSVDAQSDYDDSYESEGDYTNGAQRDFNADSLIVDDDDFADDDVRDSHPQR